ncbi:Ribose transport system permease protein RbsC [Polystyrenella longa]|uniref:Ribose transport system permease protein RbsC n=1 Tax=Polystyrenella longa TaxID=2528007 RepID=A0A518CHT6_9PLAN|nr:ABC transporter permease [Polystyrenella longa]QDU78734.1 Ribose transport system permease protein RbsC [Polystyrenella longa]
MSSSPSAPTPKLASGKSWRSRLPVEVGLLFAIAVVVLFTGIVDDSYRLKTAYNAKEILLQTSLLGIFALGAAIVIISGGIDLSSGSVIAFSGMICSAIMLSLSPLDESGNPDTNNLGAGIIALAILGTIFVGLIIGTFHTWLITVIGLPPFVATLASLVGLRSLGRVLIQDITGNIGTVGPSTKIYIFDPLFNDLGRVWWIPLLVFIVLSILLWLLMSKTLVGRHLYAMGGNEEAARLSGIHTDRQKWLAYCLGSVTASIAGILYCSYVGEANPESAGMGYELNAIAAAVIGGCSLTGGIGTITGTMLGALFLRVVIDSVAKTVKGSPDEFEGMIVGLLVVLAVAFNELRTGALRQKKFFPGKLGIVSLFILSGLIGIMGGVLSTSHPLWWGLGSGFAALLLLGLKALLERSASR